MQPPLTLVHAIALTRTGLMAPVVSDGLVFVSDRDRSLFAIDAASGRMAWKVAADYFFPFGVTGDTLLLSDGVKRRRGLSRRSGTQLWELEGLIHASGPRLFVITTEHVVMVDAETGREIDVLPPLPHKVAGAFAPNGGAIHAVVGDTILYEAGGNALVVAWDMRRGAISWERPLRDEMHRRYGLTARSLFIAADEHHIILTGDNGMVGASLEDGSPLWHAPIPVPYYFPGVAGGNVYVMHQAPDQPARLVSLDVASGSIVNDVEQASFQPLDIPSRGVICGEYIGFGTEGGLIALFRLKDGSLAWSYRNKVRVGYPAMDGKLLCVSARDGRLLIFEGADGPTPPVEG